MIGVLMLATGVMAYALGLVILAQGRRLKAQDQVIAVQTRTVTELHTRLADIESVNRALHAHIEEKGKVIRSLLAEPISVQGFEMWPATASNKRH